MKFEPKLLNIVDYGSSDLLDAVAELISPAYPDGGMEFEAAVQTVFEEAIFWADWIKKNSPSATPAVLNNRVNRSLVDSVGRMVRIDFNSASDPERGSNNEIPVGAIYLDVKFKVIHRVLQHVAASIGGQELPCTPLGRKTIQLDPTDSELMSMMPGALYSTQSRFPQTPPERYRVLHMVLAAMKNDGKFSGDVKETAKRLSQEESSEFWEAVRVISVW